MVDILELVFIRRPMALIWRVKLPSARSRSSRCRWVSLISAIRAVFAGVSHLNRPLSLDGKTTLDFISVMAVLRICGGNKVTGFMFSLAPACNGNLAMGIVLVVAGANRCRGRHMVGVMYPLAPACNDNSGGGNTLSMAVTNKCGGITCVDINAVSAPAYNGITFWDTKR